MKYRTHAEKWITEFISNQYDFADPVYPDEVSRATGDFEHKIATILEELTDDELIDMFYQHTLSYTFKEFEEDIEHGLTQENITCVVKRADRIRLSEVDKNKSSMENFKTVMDLYERALMTPAQIDVANPSEVFEAEHVIELTLEVLHDRVVSCYTCKYLHKTYDTEPCDGCLDFSEWERSRVVNTK